MSTVPEARPEITDSYVQEMIEAAAQETGFRMAADRFRFVPAVLRADRARVALARAGQDHGGDAAKMIGDVERLTAENERLRLGQDYLRLERDEASARAAKAVEVLTLIEWNGYPSGDNCPCCRGHRNFGHVQGCPFPTLLSDHPAPEPGVEAGEVRWAALEEAAKVAEAEPAYPSARAKEMAVRVDDYLSRGYSDGQIGVAILQSGSITTSRAIAAAIRALQTTTGFAPRDHCTYPGGCQHNTSCAAAERCMGTDFEAGRRGETTDGGRDG